MPAHAEHIDDTLIALADPVRRGIIELLKVQPRRAGELATLLDTNAPLMSKHLKTLRDCTLIEEERWREATAEIGASGLATNTARAASRIRTSLRAAWARRPLSGADSLASMLHTVATEQTVPF